jgi:predicted AAA+ superfamily ATPase
MIDRTIKLPQSNSFFLFGPRGVGKTTLLRERIPAGKNLLAIDLLDLDEETLYLRQPIRLRETVEARGKELEWVFIDEIQKIPPLLDVVHLLIEKHKKIHFALTGSSARKLKRGKANLLGGRAFVLNLHPFCHLELPATFSLDEILAWGSLPRVLELPTIEDRQRFLQAYAHTYLREEIQAEQIVRRMTSFRDFLDIAAQSNTKIVRYSKIARQSGVDEKSVSRFYEILVDTLVGRFLEPYDESVRARQQQSPKFYFFDTGITRALSGSLQIPLQSSTSEFGDLFEQWIVNECFRLNDYLERDFRFFFLRTRDDLEIDLVIRKPDRKLLLVEIKSTARVTEDDCRPLLRIGQDLAHAQKIVICRETVARKTTDGVLILPWREGLREIFA